jgi:ribose transport system substrate-binding protein
MKKLFSILTLLVIASMLLAGCASPTPAPTQAPTKPPAEAPAQAPAEKPVAKDLLIGVSQRWGTAAFLKTIDLGARDAAKEWEKKLGVKIEMRTTDAGADDPSQQVRDMEDLFNLGVNGLLLFPGDSKVVSDPLKSIYNANKVPVAITDIGVDSGEFVSIVVTDNRAAGELAAGAMAKMVAKGGKVVALNHAPGNNNVTTRITGFSEKATQLGLVVIPEKVIKYSIESGKQVTEDLLASDPDIAGIFLVGNVPAVGVASALDDAGNSTTKIVAFDLDSATLKAVVEGKIDATVVQDPYFMGHEAMNQLMYFLTGETAKITNHIPAPIRLLTAENAKEFEEDPQVSLE